MTLPVAPLVAPKDLRGQQNGKLHPSLLDPIDGGEVLHHLAARSWAALRDGAKRDGVRIAKGADAYRPYETQVFLFTDRYVRVSVWRPGARRWYGSWWVKKPGVAAVAVPGTSNHGWGLAVDVDDCEIEGRPACVWLKANAATYGWSAEIQSEPWHWRAVHGDAIPGAVLAYEASLAPPPPVVVPPSEEDEMPYALIQCPLAGGAVFALFPGGKVRHIGGAEFALYGAVPVTSTTDQGETDRLVRAAA